MRCLLAGLFLMPVLLVAQTEKAPPAAAAPDTRAADLLAELSKSTYTAKRAIPATDSIFIEDARVIEALFNSARDRGIAIPSSKPATISKVLLLDRAVQVFFADGKCALLILAKEDQRVESMTLAQLADLAKKGIAALFAAKPAAEGAPIRKT